MSGEERPYFRVCIYACPETQVQAVQQVLAHHLGVLFDGGEPLDLTDSYSVEEARTEFISQLVVDLRKAGPGASWVMWTDPAERKLGELHAYTPQLGLYGPVNCDAGGDVVFTLLEMMEALGRIAAGGRTAIVGMLAGEMGRPWLEDWEAHQ